MTGDSGLPSFGPAARRPDPAKPDPSKPDLVKPDPALLRISDHDRQEFVDRLTRHCAEGRIDFDELDERVAKAWAARTRSDLQPLAADLPELAAPKDKDPDLKSWLAEGKAVFMSMPSRALLAGAAGLVFVFLLLLLLAAPYGHMHN
jgi:hypothetical protein